MPFLKSKKLITSRSRMLENTAKKNGLRHVIFNTVGDSYVGEWKDNQKTGKGTIKTRNGEIYEGDVERNCRHGFGVLAQKIPSVNVYKLVYRGDWKNGKMDGYGLRVYPDGSFYMGQFKKGKRHGYGQLWSADGSFFSGSFVDDMKEGLGVLVRPDGNRFEGTWKKDKRHGKGLFLHLDSGQAQEGIWNEDSCVFSKIFDIKYRQCAVKPTPYPIPQVHLKNIGLVCENATLRALSGLKEYCLLDTENASIYNISKGSRID